MWRLPVIINRSPGMQLLQHIGSMGHDVLVTGQQAAGLAKQPQLPRPPGSTLLWKGGCCNGDEVTHMSMTSDLHKKSTSEHQGQSCG